VRRSAAAVPFVLALSLYSAVPAVASAEVDARCRAPDELLALDTGLATTRARLARGDPLTIVAIGSSSTQGYGASSPARTYPAQLEAMLRARHPRGAVKVLNMGIGGELAVQMVGRFERDVLAHQPDLVIWQTGANDAIRGADLQEFATALDRGLDLLRTRGLDVILMPPQYSARVAAAPYSEAYLELIRIAAARHRVSLFRRYEIMRTLAAARTDALNGMLTADGLHLNDLGYQCLAAQVVAAINGTKHPR
jgi:acyl-CoA thioesterase I